MKKTGEVNHERILHKYKSTPSKRIQSAYARRYVGTQEQGKTLHTAG